MLSRVAYMDNGGSKSRISGISPSSKRLLMEVINERMLGRESRNVGCLSTKACERFSPLERMRESFFASDANQAGVEYDSRVGSVRRVLQGCLLYTSPSPRD